MPEARLARTRAAYQLDTECRWKLAAIADALARNDLNAYLMAGGPLKDAPPICLCQPGFACVYCRSKKVSA
jgi:hypothetical protein